MGISAMEIALWIVAISSIVYLIMRLGAAWMFRHLPR
jgi:hypothetical protein